MLNKTKAITAFVLLFSLSTNSSPALDETKAEKKYPNYGHEYLKEDKFENFNRKVFAFNDKLNRYAIRPVHIVWASVMPKYGMDRIQSVTTNLEYPKRVASCLVQKDFKASKNETFRFLINTTVGIAGLYDPAERYFKIAPVDEDMEQALAKIKVKQGPYLIMPIMSATTTRGMIGEVLDTALDPTLYIGMPIVSLAKTGLTVNKTYPMQRLLKGVEQRFVDPYQIVRTLYGIDNYIKNANLDRSEFLEAKLRNEQSELEVNDIKEESSPGVKKAKKTVHEPPLVADIMLSDYNSQGPMIDSLRTAFFDLPNISNSPWSELSAWNKSFSRSIKTGYVNVTPGREKHKYKYMLQKDKTAPVAILYPSTGEGVEAHHSVVFARLFYDEGYSIIIQGSNFHWEFVKSMPEDYRPGKPTDDANYLRLTTSKILESLNSKRGCEFRDKIIVGTSFGAMAALFVADKEHRENTMNITKYIALSPPIDAIYALKQLDKHNEDWNKIPDIKHTAAIAAVKALQLAQVKDLHTDETREKIINSAPFSEDEAKLISSFTMRQKLSDVVFAIENAPKSKKSDIYETIHNMSYSDYIEKYLVQEGSKLEDMSRSESLYSIADYLEKNDNYKIYQTTDDYFTNQQQLKQLKNFSGKKMVLLSNGGHLGYLYRKEFQDDLKKEISFKDKEVQEVNGL